MASGLRRAKVLSYVSVQLVSKISNLCDPDPPTSQTDGQTDGRHAISIPRYALVHRAVISARLRVERQTIDTRKWNNGCIRGASAAVIPFPGVDNVAFVWTHVYTARHGQSPRNSILSIISL